METFKIKAMLSAIKHKSLSKAAEEFSYTPSAFSHILTNFENELGIKIFVRSSKGVTLTKEGEMLCEVFSQISSAEDKLWETVAEIKGVRQNELRIASFSSMSRNVLTNIIKRLKREYPHIKVSVSVADDVTGWIEQNKADMVFADSLSFGDNKWLPLFDDEFCVITPKGYFKNKEFVTRDELYTHPFVFTEGFRIEGYFDNDRFKELTVFYSEDDLSIINMVKDGFGISVIPRLVMKGAETQVDILPLKPEIVRTMGVAYDQNRIKQLGLVKFINSIK